MKTKYPKLKQELKELAFEIRTMKSKRKDHCNGYVSGLCHSQWIYRHKHITYCMLHGTPYEKIEQSTREDNKPCEHKLKQLMEKYHEIICDSLPEAV